MLEMESMTDALMSRYLPYGVKDQKQQGSKKIRPHQDHKQTVECCFNNILLIGFRKHNLTWLLATRNPNLHKILRVSRVQIQSKYLIFFSGS